MPFKNNAQRRAVMAKLTGGYGYRGSYGHNSSYKNLSYGELLKKKIMLNPDRDTDGDGLTNQYDFRPLNRQVKQKINVFNDFAKSKKSFLKQIKKTKRIINYLSAVNKNVSKINSKNISVDRGRLGNWNEYVNEYVQPVKKGEKWYEYSLNVDQIPTEKGGA